MRSPAQTAFRQLSREVVPAGTRHLRVLASASTRSRPATQMSLLPSSLQDLVTKDLASNLDTSNANPDMGKMRSVAGLSYVSRRRMDEPGFDPEECDREGLPLVYNEKRIATFWKSRPGELLGRWTRFTAIAAPWLTKLANAYLTGKLEQRQGELARDAVTNMEQLGPTFVKLGQILSIRPDVLPPPVMLELAKLQDKITPFSTVEARAMVEEELGAPITELFTEFSDLPVAAASLAQVYRARLRSTGEEVAVKVQRPGALSIISKDLYVLRRAVGVYEQLVRRFTNQNTDYQSLLSTFAEGLYTEMDFRNEALNGLRMQQLLDESEFSTADIVIPKPLLEHTTRRVLVMEFIVGVKLTTLPGDEIRALVKVGQEAFLTQLLQIGFFHGDPHPGNLLKITEGPNAGKLCLLDFGLVAEIPTRDREAMVSATIHLANRDWSALIDDFVELGFLPMGCDRGLIIPVMERILGPYLRGGGAKAFQGSNFKALSQDLLSATMEIPFSVPPYMSLLARSVATLEGIALVGDPDYQMVAEAYPFVVRKVLRNDSAGSAGLLRAILYDADGRVKATRLSALLNAGLGYVADAQASGGFIDFDAVPADGASVPEVISYLLSPEARELRPLLVGQLTTGLDLFMRDRLRRTHALLPTLVPRLPFFGALFPALTTIPIFVPGLGLMSSEAALEQLAPALSQGEELNLLSLTELTAGLLGISAADLQSPLSFSSAISFATNPSEQVRELAQGLASISGDANNAQAAQDLALEVVEACAARQAERAGVPVDTLFPALDMARSAIRQLSAFAVSQGSSQQPQLRPAHAPTLSKREFSALSQGAVPTTPGGNAMQPLSGSLKVAEEHFQGTAPPALPPVKGLVSV